MKSFIHPQVYLYLLIFITLCPILSFADQINIRQKEPNFIGAYYDGDVLITTYGHQLSEKFGLTLIHQAHLHSVRLAGRSSGFPIGDGPALNPTSVYGQDDIEYAEIQTPNLFIVNARYYIYGPFFLNGGLLYQQSYYRVVKFEQKDRTVGNTLYKNLDLKIKTKLKPRTAPIVGLGIHYIVEAYPVGLFFMLVNGLGDPAKSKLDKITVTTNQTLLADDRRILDQKIKSDAEKEVYGNFLFGITYSF